MNYTSMDDIFRPRLEYRNKLHASDRRIYERPERICPLQQNNPWLDFGSIMLTLVMSVLTLCSALLKIDYSRILTVLFLDLRASFSVKGQYSADLKITWDDHPANNTKSSTLIILPNVVSR